MISFFKPKAVLKDLIPTGFVDIHSHLLFGIDDGAKTLDDSQFLMESIKALGFGKAITTPHTTPYIWDNTKAGILDKFQEVKAGLPELTETLQLRVASEYLMDDSFSKRITEERLLTLQGDYVLVEMSYINPPMQLFDILFELISAGYKIVLAHPERYNFYHNNLEMYKKLKRAGCLFQLNLLSVTGYYGSKVADVAAHLLQSGQIDFVGSDIHHINHIRGFDAKVKIKDTKPLVEALAKNALFDF
ncbi:tyrosine-protein phosphatase [Flavobacterium sp. JP2137]|uniref:tyrosine-protein phosphatase n=1 Tax=Flavobacterium sp. JP2137 TaxID=3414510 RepID=UPI003D2FCDBD